MRPNLPPPDLEISAREFYWISSLPFVSHSFQRVVPNQEKTGAIAEQVLGVGFCYGRFERTLCFPVASGPESLASLSLFLSIPGGPPVVPW